MGKASGSSVNIRVLYNQDIEAAYDDLITAAQNCFTYILGDLQPEGARPPESPYYKYRHTTGTGDNDHGVPTNSYPDIDAAMFSEGYTIVNYPSLWDMYGKFIAGLDVEIIYEQILENMINGPTISKDISAESALLDDELNRTSYPKLTAGMRDMNAVMSSSFIYGKALLESDKIKQINQYSAKLKSLAMQQTMDRWAKHLEWNRSVIDQYMKMNELFWSQRQNWTNTVSQLENADWKWSLEVLDIGRAMVGALNGAAAAQQGPNIPSWSQAISNISGTLGALSGMQSALTGSTSGGLLGAVGISSMFSGAGAGAAIPAGMGSVGIAGAPGAVAGVF